MITEDYVSFETAKLLKEKGFDWEVHRSYLVNENVHIPGDINDVPLRKDAIRIPTLQMAMKWLREVHNYHICVQALITTDGLQGYCPFYTKVGGAFMWKNALGDDYATAPTYEEACEAAIKYCLENLI